MAMDDYETVALIAGGHTFGKTHGAADPGQYVGAQPAGAGIEEQSLGWKIALAPVTQGIRSPADWKALGLPHPQNGAMAFFEHLFGYEWELTKSPAGAQQWKPKGDIGAGTVPDAYDPSKRHAPFMLTTDLALKADPAYEKISRHFHENPAEFADAFAVHGLSLPIAIWAPCTLPRYRSARRRTDLARSNTSDYA